MPYSHARGAESIYFEFIKSNQIVFIGLRRTKDKYPRPGGGVGIWEGSLGCEFLLGGMCAEGMGCGLDGYFGEQGLPAGIQECLERFHRRCVDYLSRQFVPKLDCPNGEGELATARTASLLVELGGLDRRRWFPWGIPGDHG